jgi:hypothetical protein
MKTMVPPPHGSRRRVVGGTAALVAHPDLWSGLIDVF